MPEGERVRLTFTSFDLIPVVCADFVEVYDGHEAGSAILGKHLITHIQNAVILVSNEFQLTHALRRDVLCIIHSFQSWICVRNETELKENAGIFVQHQQLCFHE